MSNYEKKEINGKTLWLLTDQEPQPVPPNRKPVKKSEYKPKRIGKKYGERKRWW